MNTKMSTTIYDEHKVGKSKCDDITKMSTTIYDEHKVGQSKCDNIKTKWNSICLHVTKQSPISQQKQCQTMFREFIHCTLDFYLSGAEPRHP